MVQGEGGETEENAIAYFPTKIIRQEASSSVTHDTIRQMTISKQVMNHVSAVCPRSRSDETDFGMNLCACWLFVEGTNRCFHQHQVWR